MENRKQRALHLFLKPTCDDELVELAEKKRDGERCGITYFLTSSDIEAELTRRLDSHLAIFFKVVSQSQFLRSLALKSEELGIKLNMINKPQVNQGLHGPKCPVCATVFGNDIAAAKNILKSKK